MDSRHTQAPIPQAPACAPKSGDTGSRGDVQLKTALRGQPLDVQLQLLSPIQRAGGGVADADSVHTAAAHGVAGGGGALPHAAQIQRSFGRHDVGGIQAHTGANAAQATSAMGAEAYATGNHVAFGGAPSLHTAAHEAAHVVQQRAGVALSGGVGAVGDRYEKHADQVADLVVQGKSAEGVLDKMAGSGGGGSTPVQRAPVQRAAKQTHAGTFTDEKYAINGNKVDMTLKFTPGDSVDATKIGLVQSIKDVKNGAVNAIDPATRDRQTTSGESIDRLSTNNNPIYGGQALGAKEKLSDTKASNAPSNATPELNPDNGRNATYQLGHRKKVGKAWDTKDAGLYDGPTISGGNDSYKEFETTALALDGKQKGTYYGSVRWGWKKDSNGALSKYDFDVVSMGVPSKEFQDAARVFNGAKTQGTVVPKQGGISVYDARLRVAFTLDEDATMKQTQTAGTETKTLVFVTVTSEGEHKDKTGYVDVDDVKDAGDGAALVQLPVVEVKTLTAATSLFKGAVGKKTVKTLPKDTRVSTKAKWFGRTKIEVVDGPDTGLTGYLDETKLQAE